MVVVHPQGLEQYLSQSRRESETEGERATLLLGSDQSHLIKDASNYSFQ